ncbi:MAG: dihydropteroate synthase [Crocinitomicaceae bacterium]|nr:dihydropteroate synthase [Crocinitomicaceae bacterium]MBK8924821.1 dihydropteroate synthase [Crocinitomicaceae bacterium]
MGILNITPDSFYSASRIASDKDLLAAAEKMIHDGASILDLGAYSSRPGADHISEDEELRRLIPAIEKLVLHFPEMIFSLDTFRARVAHEGMCSGAHLVNDISGGQADENMFKTVAAHRATYIMMHLKGTPQTMHNQFHYDDLMAEISSFFNAQIKIANLAGVSEIIIDPGFGFSKTREQNFELLNKLDALIDLGYPLLAGVSRKSMIYKTLNLTPEESINGTTVLNSVALLKGSSILRVHDVKEARETIRLIGELKNYD